MVIDEKIYNAALRRYRLGNVVIWLGVLTWVPFIILWIAGEKPPIFWYLPFHLIGVIGGSRLCTYARKEMGAPPPQKGRLRVIGHGLIYIGVLVWAPYFYLRLSTQAAVNVLNFLPYHLTGVLGGITLLVIDFLISRKDDVKA